MRGHCWAVVGEWDGKTYVHSHESTGFVHGGAMETRRLWAAWRDRGALGVALPAEAQQSGETYLAYLARCEREGRNTKPQAKYPDLCREPGCTNPTETPVSAWCREHDRKGAFPHA